MTVATDLLTNKVTELAKERDTLTDQAAGLTGTVEEVATGLEQVKADNAALVGATLTKPDLRKADLGGANLRHATARWHSARVTRPRAALCGPEARGSGRSYHEYIRLAALAKQDRRGRGRGRRFRRGST